MRLYYPKSFSNLILAGFALVALPLVFSFIHAAIYVDRLAQQSEQAVYQAVLATQDSRMLLEQITAMERSARQYMVLGDKTIFEGYQQAHAKFRRTAESLSRLRLDRPQRRELAQLMAREQALFAVLQRDPRETDTGPADEREFIALAEQARSILAGNNRLIDDSVDVLRGIAADAHGVLLLHGLSLVPMALLLAAGFTFLIARPIRQIDGAIRRLGDGQFGGPISVNGPQDLQKLGDRLDWLRRRLVDLEAQRGKLLRHISHELKTPLTSIREGAQLLADEVAGGLNRQQTEIVGILQQGVSQLQRRIDDLLNFSVAQLRNAVLNIGPVNLARMVETVAAAHRLPLMTKGLELEMALEGITVMGDEEKLAAVVDNLLSNAIKYSPPGAEIQIVAEQTPAGVVLEVTDQGPGIGTAEWERVFDAFYQGAAAREGHVRGTGLGLSIAREYVLAHGGSIEVAKGGGRGARLRVMLPADVPGRSR